MNHSAYLATGQMIALMESFSKIKVISHGQQSIPRGSIIFVVNHFTRIETILLPYHIFTHTRVPVWSLADHTFFEGPLSSFLEKVGAVSTRNPDRDLLIVKSLLTGEANWIIFPEGQMVKDKAAAERPSFLGRRRSGTRVAHTGAATLAMRTEFYRKRLNYLLTENPAEAERLRNMFDIDELKPVLTGKTWIVPINLTYYPLRSRENVLSTLADRFAHTISDRLREELLTEGTMFFDGVDIDIRYGPAIPASESLASSRITRDMFSLQQIDFDDRLPSLPVMRREATNLMHRFMADIYRMTTVNHDHLFASLLRALPFSTISEADFRRRVFLLTEMVPDETLVYCHQSLEIGQVALLTDDRYHKFRDFLALARETGVIRYENGMLTRRAENFSAPGEFHRIRIENPLGVVANEVEPLSGLKRRVQWLAWMPEMLVRRRIRQLLLRRDEQLFSMDYAMHFRRGESKDREVGAPFLLKGSSRQTGIVLVHGFLSAPLGMRELADYLNGRGYWVYCCRLRGHGTSPEDLAGRNGGDWVESVDVGIALMRTICSKVIVGGFSFGGGLALDSAVRLPDIAGVFAVSPPFRLQDVSSRFATAVAGWNRVADALHFHDAAKEYSENRTEKPEINYLRIPIAALSEMERFMKALELRLPQIIVPALIIQGDGDPVVRAEATASAFSQVGATQKRYVPLNFQRHDIVSGTGAESVHAVIAAFVGNG